MLARAAAPGGEQPEPALPWEAFAALVPRGVTDLEVAADWKVIVEQWLESPQPHQHFLAPNQWLDVRAHGRGDPAGDAARPRTYAPAALRLHGATRPPGRAVRARRGGARSIAG